MAYFAMPTRGGGEEKLCLLFAFYMNSNLVGQQAGSFCLNALTAI